METSTNLHSEYSSVPGQHGHVVFPVWPVSSVSSVSVNICVVAGSAVSAIRIPGGPEVTRPHLLTRGTGGGSQFGQFSPEPPGHGDAPDGQISGSLDVNGTSQNFTVPEKAPTSLGPSPC